MSFALNAVETTDDYPQAAADANGTRRAYLECPGTVKLNIFVLNNGAFVQMTGSRGVGPNVQQGTERPEVFLPPAMYSLNRAIERVRFRSSAAGAPANVTVEALVAGE
jgi:hypothetical protein